MSVYTFEKSFLQRLDEFNLILENHTAHVKISWIDFLEASLEPAGYSAIWKVSKATCEALNIRYPCEVYGFVTDTSFDELSASFRVESVQDDNIHLPESCEVPLEDLYPTIDQENGALNVDITADCLDRFRFFFQKVYLPWDDQDKNFVSKLLMPRMKLFFDLKNKLISKGLSSLIRGMIAEVKYIQSKREQLELSFDESADDIDISRGESKDKARKLLELHLRMNRIKHELDILVNPEMRAIYEELKFKHHQMKTEEGGKTIFAVTKTGTLSDQMQVIQELKQWVKDDEKIHWLSLHDAIAASVPSSEIFIPSGSHAMNFLEYLSGNVFLCGLTKISVETFEISQDHHYAEIAAADSGSVLFAVDGDLKLENLIIDCENVKTGFLVRGGKLTVKNCVIFGSKDSSVTEGFSISNDAKVLIENSIVMNFATAISIEDEAKVNITNSTVKNCNVGVNLVDSNAMVSLDKSKVLNCSEFGVLKTLKVSEGKALDWNEKAVTGSFHIYLLGDSNKFDGNKSNVFVAPKMFEPALITPEDSTDVSMES